MDTAGVFSVWSLTEFSTATFSERNSGMYRPPATISSIRASAAGDSSASHRPPSEPNTFCGAK